MLTPESRLKARIKLYLKQLGAYFFMPVQTGLGKRTVDILCCIPCEHNGGRIGRFVAIETKAEGKKPTALQELTLKEVNDAGGVGFWCDTYEGFLLTMAAYGLAPRAE